MTKHTKTLRHLVDEAVASLNNLVIYLAEHPDVLDTNLRSIVEDADVGINGVQDHLIDPDPERQGA